MKKIYVCVCVCVYITESLCCTAEIKNNIVNKLYFNKIFYLFWLCWILAAANRIFNLCCSM